MLTSVPQRLKELCGGPSAVGSFATCLFGQVSKLEQCYAALSWPAAGFPHHVCITDLQGQRDGVVAKSSCQQLMLCAMLCTQPCPCTPGLAMTKGDLSLRLPCCGCLQDNGTCQALPPVFAGRFPSWSSVMRNPLGQSRNHTPVSASLVCRVTDWQVLSEVTSFWVAIVASYTSEVLLE